jgi:hypothetical protein
MFPPFECIDVELFIIVLGAIKLEIVADCGFIVVIGAEELDLLNGTGGINGAGADETAGGGASGA